MAEESSGSDNALNTAIQGCSSAFEDKNSQGSLGSQIENQSSDGARSERRASEKGSSSDGALGGSQPLGGEEEAGEGDADGDGGTESDEESGDPLPFPGLPAKVFYYLEQTDHPRDWCLRTITWPYPFSTKCFMLSLYLKVLSLDKIT